jgi:hypothetical protein
MLQAAVRLISAQGSTGTRLREIVAASDAPRGSLQHDPAPTMTGVDTQARAAFAAAQQAWADAGACFDRGPVELRGVERGFRAAARRLEQARDPLTSDAWLGAARASRYQPGRRDKDAQGLHRGTAVESRRLQAQPAGG